MIRVFLSVLGMSGLLLLLLPCLGISVDVVTSGSMEPVIRTGSIILTDTRQRTLSVGDIAEFRLGENKVSHRIVEKIQQSYRTKGDANDTADAALIEQSQVIGKVILSIPFAGYVAVFIQQKTVFAVLACMLIQELIFMMLQNKKIWKMKKRGVRMEQRRRGI